jgi:alanyl-tRNA synthetase
MTSNEIRQQFIDFFVQRHGHTFVPSSPVVPHDDPTLLFTNAGMNQFKPYFLGTERAPWPRVANTQKCIRAGGKHNDLDDVGRSRRHGTFFEMLGNWSFGDYFKRGAIEMAWELLTNVWRLDPSRLHVTCYEGGDGVPRDDEAARLWKEIARLPDDHIHYFGAKDNFWEMGETGPCGPCTEINIDRRPQAEIDADRKAGRRAPVNGDDPRVMEFWNLVFIQYNRNPDRSLTPLPAQHVDTGMGFERICQILQGKDAMYAIDLFEPFFAKLTELTGIKYSGCFPKTNAPDPEAEARDEQLRHDIAFRVVADHIRTLTFAVTDGAVPSNEGRGYVLRRILRRAVRFGRQQLELHEPFLHQLVEVVVESMGGAFPELRKNPTRVRELIHGEEVSFGKTLERGIELFNDAIVRSAEVVLDRPLLSMPMRIEGRYVAHHFAIPADSGGQPLELFDVLKPEEWRAFAAKYAAGKALRLSAHDAFKLHDTYGFPIDLTQLMATERGMNVDLVGYERLMEEARERARAGGRAGASRLWELPPNVLAELQKMKVVPTDDSAKYNAAPLGATVRAIWLGSHLSDATHGAEAAGQGVAVILDQTNFYAEQGGQVGDTGELRSQGGAVMVVETTRAAGGYVLHVGNMIEGHLSVGDHVTSILAGVRPRTEKNHTATHLANWALREVLGDGVQQKGSLVDPDKLRFDFSHNKSLAPDEVERVESLVRECIAKKMTVHAEVAPQEQALKINGLRAVFGEKYPPAVRVVSIGVPVADLLKDPTNAKWRQYSVEFCGGTHLRDTSEVGDFVVTSEESVSKGVRRIVALTGDAASAAGSESDQLLQSLDRARALPEPQLPQTIASLQKQLGGEHVPLRARHKGQSILSELQAKYKAWEKSQRATAPQLDVATIATNLLERAIPIGPGKLIVDEIPGAGDDQLRTTMDSLKKRTGSFGILLGSAQDGKVTFVAAVSDDLIAKGLKAGDWVREAAKVTGGGGGGKPQMAQAGGKDASKLSDALEVARRFARERVS